MSESTTPYQPPSEAFLTAFSSGSGGCRRTCECGRTHFEDSSFPYTWEPGELEGLQARAAKGDGNTIGHRCSISTYIINGMEYVMDCPCHGGRQFEDFIRENAARIASYLNTLAEAHRKKAGDITVKDPEGLR